MLELHKIFGGKTCQKIALQLEDLLQDLLAFSICSDERLPDGLEDYLINENIPQHLLIVGDFISSFPSKNESPASYEAIKIILTLSNLKLVNVCWINSVEIKSNNLYQKIKWKPFRLSHLSAEEKKDRSLVNNIKTLCISDKKNYYTLCKLLNSSVYVEINDNKIVSIDLTDNQVYPRGLTNNLSSDKMLVLWSIISQIPYLKKINASFNALLFLPDLSKLSQLERLDLRGNPNLDLNALHKAKALSYLNISACSLKELPSSINSLQNLKSLLAYKNHITDISNIKFPKCIERISLYRNQIGIKTLELSHCNKLQEINLGANPIVSMTLITSPKLRTLKLRARHIKGSIILDSDNTTLYISEY